MKTYRWITTGLVASLILAVVSYFWATSLMDSLYAYRSPFASQPPQAGQPIGEPLSRRVVVILIDALRTDTAADPTVMPFLNSLRAQGASATIHSGLPSYSAPSWTVLATGAWQDLSDGPAMNPNEKSEYLLWTQDNIFAAAHNAGLKTAVAANEYFSFLVPPEMMAASAWTVEEMPADDQQNIDNAVKFIQSGGYDYIFTYIVNVDYAGHEEGGPRDPRWNEAAARADKLIEQVVSSLDLSQDTVLIYSDHGQIDTGGHGGQDPVVLVQPFIMAGANVKPGIYPDIQQVDIAPTTAVLLGTAIPAISQGHPLVEMLNLTPEQAEAIRNAAATQQAGLYEAYVRAMNVQPAEITLTASDDPVNVYQSALMGLKNTRLNRERLLRFLILVPLMLVPVYFFYHNRSQKLLWIFVSVIIYLATYHIKYAILGGGTYTLSTVLSASDLISSTAINTGLALLVAWLAGFFSLRLFAMPRLQAVHTHLALTSTILYFVSLPALWSLAYNGALVRWTLPDVASMFVGFIFTLQALFIAVLGLPLMAVTALAARKS